VDQNEIGGALFSNITAMLISNKILKVLHLSNSNIGDDGCMSIAEGLWRNPCLKTIYLNNNHLTVSVFS
jgi:hypothetical protein